MLFWHIGTSVSMPLWHLNYADGRHTQNGDDNGAGTP
jgi:hypothetical protein